MVARRTNQQPISSRDVNLPLPKSSFGGKLGQELETLRLAINSLRPIPTPGAIVTRTSGGTSIQPVARRSLSDKPLKILRVVNILDDTLECYSEPEEGNPDAPDYTVWKHFDLRVSTYADYDGAAIDAFWNSNTYPGYPPATELGEYTEQVYMAGGPDGSNVENCRAVQQRYRFVYAINANPGLADSGKSRSLIQEVVWPPYYGFNLSGYTEGSVPVSGGTASQIYAAQDESGAWHELLPARRWVNVETLLGDANVYSKDGTDFGSVDGTWNGSMSSGSNYGLFPRA